MSFARAPGTPLDGHACWGSRGQGCHTVEAVVISMQLTCTLTGARPTTAPGDRTFFLPLPRFSQPGTSVPAQVHAHTACRAQALSMQLRHVWSRQYRHSQMNQNGPQWQTWHVHSIRVLSDLIMTKEWAQWLWLASAMLENVRLAFVEW
ncbi:hypothetical protein CHGG_03847 [Chaetomium globosum CBS 148.51]|uniref:Uncharacterized protein n=1 Tax=Chaetomium globosum (strain ATCC 6205 / CBS 148.51 / DSM 1962 / NBRC 6347 / NRRL 1970) TaxID=306901 RepID=Q2H2Z9_CHAGB|nr:uncharacterized protein CHGG_03847 [Chaetomium globosum CBS 148.51]EAQ87228.1 hypothetical protein CHGG_03847 [Chaetomium globosum CBS 148.51]